MLDYIKAIFITIIIIAMFISSIYLGYIFLILTAIGIIYFISYNFIHSKKKKEENDFIINDKKFFL